MVKMYAGYKGKLLIKPAKKNVQTFSSKVRDSSNTNKQSAAGNLVGLLNPVIRGWANYHSHAVSADTYDEMDDAIFKTLWQWAKRRQPKKNRWWIKDKYFTRQGESLRVFYGQAMSNDGKPKNLHLFRANLMPSKRHTKVNGEANPYAPEWETYFAHRLAVQLEANLKG